MNRQPLSAERYTSSIFADREWESVWVRSWLVLGHEGDIPEPGDFLVEDLGPESVLMVRQTDGSIKCFYNLCPHRGNRLVSVTEGGAAQFTCGYHGWRYSLAGDCVHVQDPETFTSNPCDSVRLEAIRSECYGGFVWINFDGQADPLTDYLGETTRTWAAYPCDRYIRMSATSIRLDCNWKTAMDNFHEAYHVASAHPIGLNYMEDSFESQVVELYDRGHSLNIHNGSVRSKRLPLSEPMGFQIENELRQWDLDPDSFADNPFATREALQRAKREKCLEKGFAHYQAYNDRQLTDPHHVTVFPNLAVTFNPDGMLFLRAIPDPKDPEKCLLDTWFYAIDPDSFWAKMLSSGAEDRADGEHAPRRIINVGEGSLGPVLDDDAWVLLEQQKGFRSRAYRGAILSKQESRIQQYHDEIDRLMRQAQE